MSVVIQLLEKMGQNSELRYADAGQLAQLMADTDPKLVAAVTAGDQQVIEALLNVRSNVVCGIFPADEPQDEQPADDDDNKEKISQLKAS
jgi:hypothetical protein